MRCSTHSLQVISPLEHSPAVAAHHRNLARQHSNFKGRKTTKRRWKTYWVCVCWGWPICLSWGTTLWSRQRTAWWAADGQNWGRNKHFRVVEHLRGLKTKQFRFNQATLSSSTHPAGHSAVEISSQSPCTQELSPREGIKQRTARLACLPSVSL